jgi:hypothetical protein
MLPLMAQQPALPVSDSNNRNIVGLDCRIVREVPFTIMPLERVVRMSHFGWSAGYTSSFAHIDKSVSNGSIDTKPGFELSVVYRRHLYKRFSFQTGLGFVSRNFTVNALGASFAQRNDRWFVPLLLYTYPFSRKGKWVRGICLKAGTQVDFYNYGNAVTRWNASGVGNVVVHRSQPEIFAVAEIGWNLRPLRPLYHYVSLAFAYGLNKTYMGSVGTVSETAFRYSNTGTYLSAKYTFFIRNNRR